MKMNRLTKEQLENYKNTYDRYEGIESNEFEKLCDELIEYKLLEEELGIDLITLFKALKEGIYIRDYGYLLVEHFVLKSEHELHCRPTYRKELRFTLKDYGKTWALRKEDLQDE